MLPSAPRSTLPRPESLHALIARYTERHRALENYNLAYAFLFWVLRRLRLEPRGRGGRLGAVLFVIALFLGGPLAVTAALDEWDVAPIATWAVVAVGFGLLGVAIYGPLQRAIDTFLSLHRAIAEEEGIRHLIAWDRRWFSLRVSIPVASGFSLAVLAYLYLLEQSAGEPPLAWGTALVGMMLLYQVGEIAYFVIMLGLESYVLRRYTYELYRLSPLDSVAVRRTQRGSTRIGVLVSLLATVFIVGFVVLLGAERPILASRVALVLLVLAYAATLVGVLLPRQAMRWIVQVEKERELEPLQRRLDALAARVGELDDAEFREYERLRATHDAIRGAAEAAVPLRTVGQLLGALVPPTVTFFLTRFGDAFLRGLINDLRR